MTNKLKDGWESARSWVRSHGAKGKIAAGIAGVALVAAIGAGTQQVMTGTSPFGDGRVAARVNGEVITEGQVTELVMLQRDLAGTSEDEAWRRWLSDNDQTPELVRSNALSTLVHQVLVEQAAADQGLTVTNDEVDKVVNDSRAAYEAAIRQQAADVAGNNEPQEFTDEELDDAWEAALATTGYDEQTYWEATRTHLLEAKLEQDWETVVSNSDISYEDAPSNLPYA